MTNSITQSFNPVQGLKSLANYVLPPIRQVNVLCLEFTSRIHTHACHILGRMVGTIVTTVIVAVVIAAAAYAIYKIILSIHRRCCQQNIPDIRGLQLPKTVLITTDFPNDLKKGQEMLHPVAPMIDRFEAYKRSSYVDKEISQAMQKALREWVKDSSISGEKIKVAQKITKAFYTQATDLDLSDVGLDPNAPLPDCLSYLTKLKNLKLPFDYLGKLPTFSSLEVSKESIEDFMHRSLNEWIKDPNSSGQKEEAARRILEVLHVGSSALDLDHLDLNNLPNCLQHLTTLTELEFVDLHSKFLTDFPLVVCKLKNLKKLSIYFGGFTSLPAEIKELNKLEKLELKYCRLKTFPKEILSITNLRELTLAYTHINTIPDEINQLNKLQKLILNALPIQDLPNLDLMDLKHLHVGKTKLTSLPDTLELLPQLSEISIQDTQIPIIQQENILVACALLREDKTPLSSRLETWMSLAKVKWNEQTLQLFLGFDEHDQRTLNAWLRRLQQSKDYKICPEKVANLVCQILQTLIDDKEERLAFKTEFFRIAEVNNTRCADRSAMTLNEVYTLWKLHTRSEKASFKEKMALMISCAKTHALRRIITAKITEREKEEPQLLKESVEIFLYFETILREKLQLITASEQMHFEDQGKVNWIDETDLIKSVNNTFTLDLVNLTMFDAFVANDERFKKCWTADQQEKFTVAEEIARVLSQQSISINIPENRDIKTLSIEELDAVVNVLLKNEHTIDPYEDELDGEDKGKLKKVADSISQAFIGKNEDINTKTISFNDSAYLRIANRINLKKQQAKSQAAKEWLNTLEIN